MGASKRAFCLLVASLTTRVILRTSADIVYAGNKYNASFSDGESCAYPAEATLSGTCPETSQSFGLAGVDAFNLSDYNDSPPVVYTAISMVQFGGIDQTQLTFTMTLMLDMIWEDNRGFEQIQRATTAALKTGKCSKNCIKGAAPGGLDFCCDGLWLPTLKILSGQQRTFVEEDYQIASFRPSTEYSSSGLNLTEYIAVLTATFYQPFDFTAFPFDRHALSVRILCVDCQMRRQTDFGLTSADFATVSIVSPQDSTGTSIDRQSVPASAGWQLNAVNLVVVNATTDYSEVRPRQRKLSSVARAKSDPDYYGIVFILQVERVTRLFYTLQTIVPPIVLTLIGFTCFLIPQTNFTDRLKTLISVLFPTFVVQFTITNTLPKTSTLLSPQYLVFISIIEIAMLIAVAGVTTLILNRQSNFEWSQKVAKGKRQWSKKRSLPKSEQAAVSKRDEESLVDPKLSETEIENESPPPLAEGDAKTAVKSAKEIDESDPDVAIHQRAANWKKWPPPFRSVVRWWTLLALSSAEGYREHLAMVWELSALAVCFIIYMAAVLAIFLTLDEKGKNPSTY